MRIIAGALGGRLLKSPQGADCRPAMGRTREALFSMLGARGILWEEVSVMDIFAGSGVTDAIPTKGNTDGIAKTLALADRDFEGLCFVNLVDFDMLYGHRNDIDGYAAALTEFDNWLDDFLPKMREDDVLMITADHGCDPGYPGTDHTREAIPLLMYGRNVKPRNLGTHAGFDGISRIVKNYLM